MNSKCIRKVILIRHAQSIWNHDSKFTGWTNIPLTDIGRKEAKHIASTLIDYNIRPNIYFSSVLDRSIETAKIIKKFIMKSDNLYTSWRLNEKHYGTLEGIPRQYIRDEYGDKFTNMMRNNFYMKPPVLTIPEYSNKYQVFKNCYYNSIKHGESKENVLQRLLPYFQNDILYTLSENKLPIVVTHKHCIRVLMKHYLKLNEEEFEEYKIPDKSILIVYFRNDFEYNHYELINYK
jgi:2,3-bisphosphoglycerate-dependent phosphoglycerate mutase